MNNVRNLLGGIFQGRFAKGVFMIGGGSATAQFISIVLTPVITRLYSPEDYGVLAVYSAILGLMVIPAALHYYRAIPLSEEDETAINVLALSLLVLSAFCLIIALLLTFHGDFFLGLFDGDVLFKYRYLIPIGIFASGLYSIFTQWALRKQDYGTIAKTSINQSIFGNLLKVVFGILKLGPIGLILGIITGQSAGISSLLLPILKQQRYLLKSISIKRMHYAANRYIKFPMYSCPGEFVYAAGNLLPALFIGNLFGKEVLGYYALANSMINLPIGLIGNSVAQVFYAEAANIGKGDPVRIKKLAINLMKKMAIIGLLPLFVLLLFGPFLFFAVFGNNWLESGVYARIICFIAFGTLIITPVGRILEIFEQQRQGLFLNLLRLILVLIVFFAAKILCLSSHITIGMYSAFIVFFYLIAVVYIIKMLNKEISNKDTYMNEQ